MAVNKNDLGVIATEKSREMEARCVRPGIIDRPMVESDAFWNMARGPGHAADIRNGLQKGDLVERDSAPFKNLTGNAVSTGADTGGGAGGARRTGGPRTVLGPRTGARNPGENHKARMRGER